MPTAITICNHPALLPDDLASAPQLIDRLRDVLGLPADPLERLRFQAIADDLSWLDGDSVADLFDQSEERFGGAYTQLAAYSLVVLAVTKLARRGMVLVGRERLLRIICRQVCAELGDLPLYLSHLWLIPANPAEHAAVHVGALLLNRCGEATRPWLSDDLPDHGRFMIIGSDLSASGHPFAGHHRCVGITDFAHLAIHSPATC